MALTIRDIVVDIYRDEMVPYLDSMTTREVEYYLCLSITGCYKTMMCNFREQFTDSSSADLLSESHRSGTLERVPNAAYFATIGDFEMLCHSLSKGYDDACLDKVVAYAAANGHIDIVKHTVAMGATSDGIDAALYRAVTREHLCVVKFLISSQPHTYAFQGWLSYLAAETGNNEIVDFLIQQGADDIEGMIMHACDYKRYETVDHLIKMFRDDLDLEWIIDRLEPKKHFEAVLFLKSYLRKSYGSQENKQN